mmetsp:Transcript_14076/g.28713  ORF Transcript_14076/g.28713 Transcript_14076/m.28713 type:complete len:430 (-) Transcript_14076:1753-3042(-)
MKLITKSLISDVSFNKASKAAISLALFATCAVSTVNWNRQLSEHAHTAQTHELHPSFSLHSLHYNNSSYVEPIRFIAVGGLYHSGTTNMLDTIERNTFLADSKGLHLHAFREGYPPCGVPLNPDGTVDTFSIHGDQPGINEENGELGNKWGVMWADWTKMGKTKTSVENTRGPTFRRGMHQKFHRNMPLVNQEVLETSKPHDFNPFFAWWKHVPPQHPMMACFRPDTLYVIMVRHPKVWIKSLMKKRYDLMLDRSDKKFPWRLIRSNPRRLPPLDMRFQSLYHMWAYYMNGYLSWAKSSAGGDCYGFKTSRGDKQMTKNCLGENNEIPNDRRNILIVRQEDFAHNPKKILAQIFSFATRGVINAEKAENDFILLDGDGSDQAKKIENLKESGFYSAKSDKWEGAKELPTMCLRLGYSCDDSPNLFIDDD